MRRASARRPSETSIIEPASLSSASARPRGTRSGGRTKRSRAAGSGVPPRRHASTAAAEPPRRPDTQRSWPGAAPLRRTGRRARPRAATSTTTESVERTTSPPATGAPARSPARRTPRCSSTPTAGSPGSAIDTRRATGLAPIAARSLSAAAPARNPASRGDTQSNRKCTPSAIMSVLTTNPPRSTAASSPGPSATSRLPLHPAATSWSTSSCSFIEAGADAARAGGTGARLSGAGPGRRSRTGRAGR